MDNPEQLHEEPKENSVLKNLRQATALMDEQAALSPQDFLTKYAETTKSAFPDSVDAAIETGAVPVLICARNEEKRIGATLRGLSLAAGIQVKPIVVDNGSTDMTAEIARSMGAEVVPEEHPGLPNALRKGFSYLKDLDYRGPILHTDADTVPLPTWAKTMVDFAETQMPNGGHAYGSVIHYDGKSDMLKNSVLTAGRLARDYLAKRKGIPNVHVRNGVILTGSDNRLIDELADLKNPTETITTDGAIYNADVASGKAIEGCYNPEALVVTSGRRHSTVRGMILGVISPRRFNPKTYTEAQDTPPEK